MQLTHTEVKIIRNLKGLTREEFANLLGVSVSYIYLIESGKKPLTAELEAKVIEKCIKEEATLIAIKFLRKQLEA
ncbi:helix-turn-helix transcriptional regulator [Priestia megaterium]|uniref:helix-turn-helix domain-containing protein n=1 Tax=Priestia megaterium TaxID=1404 RepID=UPI002E1EB87D|nr:helix-turn-helix transcriptional regulator [Priestia megaterium]